ncbi:MAG: ATP-binding protein [Inhella sp.]
MKRSLGRRLIAALLVAYALITLLLVAWNYWEARSQLVQQSPAQMLGSLLARSVEKLRDAESACAVAQGFASELERLRKLQGYAYGGAGVNLRDGQGRSVCQYGPQPAAELSEGLSQTELHGRPHAVFQAQGGPWRVQVLDPLIGDDVLILWVLSEIGSSLLLALPVLLLTLWLAVRTGLAPLRRFTARIAALDTRQERAALNLDLRYAELQPLGEAFDALLKRLREQLARERALIHDAAHELRTPLAALGAQAHVLLNSRDEAGRAQAAQALQQGLSRTAHLSQQLLDLARLDQERPPQPETLDLAELAATQLRQAHPQARARGVQLGLQAPEALPWQAERVALQTLLQNLLDNAIRYGAREVELQLGQGPDGRPWLAVADDGPGVPPEQHQQMFERFWRGAQSQESGTGLGLAIVAQALQRLGARLRISNGLQGRGIAFHVGL